MGKIRLNLDDIVVESFETTSHEYGRSTVQAQTHGGQTCGAEHTCGGGACNSYHCNTFDEGATCAAACTSEQASCDGLCGTETCIPLNCPDNTYVYNTCNCANDSVAGWASCGTTCQPPECPVASVSCDTICPTCGYQNGCGGSTSPEMAC